MFGFESPDGGLTFNEGETGEVCVILVSGVVSLNTTVTLTSGLPGDTAIGIEEL